MINISMIIKKNVFGINYSIVDYNSASDIIIQSSKSRRSFGVTALAVHGLIESYNNHELKDKINTIDLVVPDGQPIRWALNSFYKVGLRDRVYGPTLTKHVLEKANVAHLGVFLFGSTSETLEKFSQYIQINFPNISIRGTHTDRFREATPEEDAIDIKRINDSGANIILVGRGCPRQELWVANHLGLVHGAMMAVGAAFNFHAGNLKQAPKWMQDSGLEWLYRLIQEPGRLWKRYLFTNTQFIYLFLKHQFIKKV